MNRSRLNRQRPAWLFVDLWSAARRSVRVVAELLEEQGVGDHELAALLHLAAAPSGLTATELSGEMGVAFMSASDAVGRLERAGDVERVPHPSDARSAVLRLTPHGSSRADAALELLDRLAQELAERGGAQGDELEQLAARLNEVLSATD